MTDPSKASIAVFRERAGAQALAGQLRAEGSQVVAGAEVAVSLLLTTLQRRLTEPAAADRLAEVVGSFDPAGLDDAPGTFASGRYAPSGLRLVDQLLDDADSRGRAAGAITEASGLAPGSGSDLLSAAAWVIGTQLSLTAGAPLDGDALAAAVDGRPRRSLPPAPASALAPIVSGPDDSPLYGSARRSPEPPVHPSLAPSVDEPSAEPEPSPEPTAVPTPVPAVASARPTAPRRAERTVRPDEDLAVGSSRLVTGVAVILGLLVVGVGALWWSSRDGGETITSAETAETDPAPTDADDGAGSDSTDDAETSDEGVEQEPGDESAGSAGDGDEGDGPTEPERVTSIIGPDGRAAIGLAMLDPVGRSSATGSADLVFDPSAGEICYEMGLDGVGEPADGHIHLGPMGVKGGVVVDFGPMTDGLVGCHPVTKTEIDAILADLDGHYVELHDPVEEFTVRAQLSEGVLPDGQPIVTGDEAATDEDPDAPVLFDPDGGGAIAVIEPGRIVLRGDVPDRETAERVLVDFAGLSQVVVVDELTVVPGASLPSGRVIIDSPGRALFASDSDVLDADAGPLVDQLVALMGARPDWQVTVVGHTDSTGNEVINLELSLRRAEAVRQELLDGGVASPRVRVRGAGSTDPLADNATTAGRAQNRRIEFEIAR